MARLSMFNFITLDGMFKGPGEDISWHNFGEDEQKLSNELSHTENTLIFGRVTYQMMYSHWASADTLKNDPITAQGMNQARKIVFSKTLPSAEWENTTLIKGNVVAEVEKLKARETKDMTIIGSGQICAQLADANLIDDFMIMLNPLAIGEGTSLFKGLSHKIKLNLKSVRTMKSGNLLLNYSR